jgi:hypothetical protein
MEPVLLLGLLMTGAASLAGHIEGWFFLVRQGVSISMAIQAFESLVDGMFQILHDKSVMSSFFMTILAG